MQCNDANHNAVNYKSQIQVFHCFHSCENKPFTTGELQQGKQQQKTTEKLAAV